MTGQASIEYLAILSVALIVLVAIVALAGDRMVAIANQKKYTDARNTVNDLARSCDEVYQQGAGAKKRVFVVMPSGTDFSGAKTYIGRPEGYPKSTQPRSLNLNVDGSDVHAQTKEDVQGTFPASEGGSYLWVESKGTYCLIGAVNLEVDSASVYVLMAPSSSAQKTVTVYNNANVSLDIALALDWTSGTVSLSASDSSFTLSPETSRQVTLTFSSGADSIGIHSGKMTVSGNGSGIEEEIVVPITVDVVQAAAGGGAGSNCTAVDISILTYNDSGYSQQDSSFVPAEDVAITSGDWTPGSTVTLNIFLNSAGPGSPVAGYPKSKSANASGGFSESWSTSGIAGGVYNVSANASGTTVSQLFTVSGCS